MQKTRPLATIAAVLAPLVVASCGGSDDGRGPAQSGVFLDSPVKGLYYEATPSGRKGTTDVAGTFHFEPGDDVTFYLAADAASGARIKLGTAKGASVLTPIEITRHEGGMLTDVLQVLQSLDADEDLSNGIEIVSSPPGDCNLEDQSGCRIGAAAAQEHFAATLARSGVPAQQSYLGTSSKWTSSMDESGCLIRKGEDCYTIKGITYSPAPVGYDASKGPALGDLFWDSFRTVDNGTQIHNWYSLWGDGRLGDTQIPARDDLEKIKDLGVNTIRVYAMLSRQLLPDGSIPDLKGGQVFTHEQFLDKCAAKGLHVLVDIPLPDTLFWQKKYEDVRKSRPQEIEFWETVLKEVADELKRNPAVMGFSIMNEKDGDNSAFMDDGSDSNARTDFFYYQAIRYAREIKRIAPDKLVGWAIHDAPKLVYWASTHRFSDGPLKGQIYFEALADAFHYWGVNTYQMDRNENQPMLRPVLGNSRSDTENQDATQTRTYNTLTEKMRRPVIFTEWGWPGTGRVGDAATGAIMEDESTRQEAASVITRAFGQAYGSNDYGQDKPIDYRDILAGVFFFSYSHEWWKSGNPGSWEATRGQSRIDNFPNHFWDEEGFGLFKIGKIGEKQGDGSPWCGNGPCLPYDELEPMSPMTEALRDVYRSH